MSSTKHDNRVTFSCVDKIVIIIYFPERRSIEILTNLWGVKGHIRSGREMLSSRDSEVKIFKNIFLPQGWYNWWCIFYRSLMDEIFLNCFLHILSLLWAFPAPDRIRQVRKYTPSLFLLHLNSHLLRQLMLKTFIFKEFATFMSFCKDTLRRRFSTKHFRHVVISIKNEEQIVWKLSWIEVNN